MKQRVIPRSKRYARKDSGPKAANLAEFTNKLDAIFGDIDSRENSGDEDVLVDKIREVEKLATEADKIASKLWDQTNQQIDALKAMLEANKEFSGERSYTMAENLVKSLLKTKTDFTRYANSIMFILEYSNKVITQTPS